MNREIEFRAWLKDEKRMITKISSIKVDIKCIYYDNNQMFSYERASFDEIELMQYTNKNDKHNNEIFEGDIVLYNDKRYVVYWCELELAVCICFENETLHLGNCYSYELEVIGNIYENPELLGA